MRIQTEGAARLDTLTDEQRAAYAPVPDAAPPTVREPPMFYVDPAVHRFRGQLYGHLMTTGTEADLVAFGRRIGLQANWIQKAGTDAVHFDVNERNRQKAIDAGAVCATSTVMFRACVITKRQAMNPGNAAALLEALGEMDEGKEGGGDPCQ